MNLLGQVAGCFPGHACSQWPLCPRKNLPRASIDSVTHQRHRPPNCPVSSTRTVTKLYSKLHVPRATPRVGVPLASVNGCLGVPYKAGPPEHLRRNTLV